VEALPEMIANRPKQVEAVRHALREGVHADDAPFRSF
jgi:hypothetical protein